MSCSRTQHGGGRSRTPDLSLRSPTLYHWATVLPFENVESIKYLGVTITSDLRWNTHVSNVCTKANSTLGFLRRNLYSCPHEVKESAYKGLVRPILDYGSSVWDPAGVVLQEELESVQKRAARFVTGNYNYETGSMTGILGQLKWESLKKKEERQQTYIAI